MDTETQVMFLGKIHIGLFLTNCIFFKQKAQEKADAIETLLGYPDWLPDPVELDDYFKGIRPTEATTHFDNMLGVKYWASGKELYSLRDTPERTIWLTQPAIVNAFYSPNHNSISTFKVKV